MAVSTYSGIKAAVADYLNRDDLTAQIDDFIDLTEAKLNRNLRIRQMLKASQATTTADDDTVSLPTDYIEMKSLHIVASPKKLLRFYPPSAFLQTYAASTVGEPKAFSMLGSDIKLGPTPGGEYTLEMLYYAKLDALSTSNETNSVLDAAPDVYLYGTLLEAEPFLMNDARMQTWGNLYASAFQSLVISDEAGLYPATLQQSLDYTLA